ncbi:MAG: prevent-host-death protein [Spirochaetes bacterium]|nr:prevent-host-death protein [Spirochaetota bacterium]
MGIITANELKKHGISIIDSNQHEETIITVRGQQKYVVVDMETYNYLRECELETAFHEVKDDIKNGKYYQESVEAHIKRIENA